MRAASVAAAAARTLLGRWCLAALLVAASSATALSAAAAPPASPDAAVVSIDRAVASTLEQVADPSTAAGSVVSLPDIWFESRPAFEGDVWYRAGADISTLASLAQEAPALYVEHACVELHVWVNGHLVHGDGEADEGLRRDCTLPRLISLPPALLQAGANAIDLRVQGPAAEGVSSIRAGAGLSALQIGRQSTLAAEHVGRLVWLPAWMQASAGLLVGLGSVLVVVGALYPREVYFSYFGGLCLAWVALPLLLALPAVPWPGGAEIWRVVLWAVLLGLAVQFLLGYAGLRSRLIERWLLLQPVAVLLLLWLLGEGRLFDAATLCYVLFALQLAGVASIYLGVTRRQRREDFGPMAWALGAGCALFAGELAQQRGGWGPPAISVAQVLMPLLLASIGGRLFMMFARALRTTERERQLLARRLQALTAEFDTRLEQTTAAQVEQFIERERKRIASDLHDDLGAKLLTIVHTRDSSQIPQLARESLEEMRLSVRGLAGKPVLLADALGDWRAEVMERLGQANVAGTWSSPEEGVAAQVPARVFMQMTRILREAISNVIKHSGAARCEVICEIASGTLRMVIRDYGHGISADLNRGQGMASMKRRAKKMEGQCLVESRPGHGVVISVTVPL